MQAEQGSAMICSLRYICIELFVQIQHFTYLILINYMKTAYLAVSMKRLLKAPNCIPNARDKTLVISGNYRGSPSGDKGLYVFRASEHNKGVQLL